MIKMTFNITEKIKFGSLVRGSTCLRRIKSRVLITRHQTKTVYLAAIYSLPRIIKPQTCLTLATYQSGLNLRPIKGHIWFDQRRMFLLHSRAFGALRQNMIENTGASMARAILMRAGYTAGSVDAEMASRVRKNDDLFDVFSVGPQMHALLGVTLAECVDFDVDVSKGKFTSEYIWHDSIEDDAHLRFFDIGPDPVCWFQIGYASGFSSVFIGRQIIYKEVECRAQGYKHCRIVGKTYEEWDDASDEMAILQPHLQNFNQEAAEKKITFIRRANKKHTEHFARPQSRYAIKRQKPD